MNHETATPIAWKLAGVSVGERLRDVTVSISSDVTAVLGASGAGKSTLLEVLAGLTRPTSGDVTTHPNGPPDDNGVSCEFALWAGCGEALWPHLSAAEQISHVGGDPNDWLPRFDLSERRDERPSSLSQGERSRLELARALAARPTTLLLDEPLTHVDRRRAASAWQELTRWTEHPEHTLVFSTHDLGAARALANDVICLDGGRLTDAGPLDRVCTAPKSDAAAWAVGSEGTR